MRICSGYDLQRLCATITSLQTKQNDRNWWRISSSWHPISERAEKKGSGKSWYPVVSQYFSWVIMDYPHFHICLSSCSLFLYSHNLKLPHVSTKKNLTIGGPSKSLHPWRLMQVNSVGLMVPRRETVTRPWDFMGTPLGAWTPRADTPRESNRGNVWEWRF